MGASQSSIARSRNDFELVVRATKELEVRYLLFFQTTAEDHVSPPLKTMSADDFLATDLLHVLCFAVDA